ncbi:putative Ig domain-containing protein [Kaarinaea lacus]
MRSAYLVILLGLFTFLTSGCGDTEENSNQNAPYFNNIGTPTVTGGDTMNFTVIATDPNDMNVTLTYDGTLGPNANPFTAGATFNETTGVFTWVTDSNDVGDYSVRFTATNDAVPPLTTHKQVTLRVLAVPTNSSSGETLYNQRCQSCHGTNGVNGTSAGIVQCSSEISIREALGLVQGVSGVGAMSGISLTTQEIQDIANFLQSFPGC